MWCAGCFGSCAGAWSSPSAAPLKLSPAGWDGVPGPRVTPVAPVARIPAALSLQVRVGQGWEGGGCQRVGQGLGLEGPGLRMHCRFCCREDSQDSRPVQAFAIRQENPAVDRAFQIHRRDPVPSTVSVKGAPCLGFACGETQSREGHRFQPVCLRARGSSAAQLFALTQS